MTNSGADWGSTRLRTRCSESLHQVFSNRGYALWNFDADHLGSGGRFIPDIKKAKLVRSLSPNAEIWTLYYELSAVMSPRVFTVLQVKQLGEADSKKEGYALISFPHSSVDPN